MSKRAVAGIVVAGVAACMAIAAMVYPKISVRWGQNPATYRLTTLCRSDEIGRRPGLKTPRE